MQKDVNNTQTSTKELVLNNLQEYKHKGKPARQSKSRQALNKEIDPNYFKKDDMEGNDDRGVKKVKTLTMQGSDIGSVCDKSLSSEHDDRAPVTIFTR